MSYEIKQFFYIIMTITYIKNNFKWVYYYIIFNRLQKGGGASQFDIFYSVYVTRSLRHLWTDFNDRYISFKCKCSGSIYIWRKYSTWKYIKLGDECDYLNFAHLPFTICNKTWHFGVIPRKIKSYHDLALMMEMAELKSVVYF